MRLACLGAPPCFEKMLPVGGPIAEPAVIERFHRLADQAFAVNYLTNDGPLSRRLEEETASRHNVRHAVFMANATLAQLVLMKSMGLECGEALIPTNTFVSAPHVAVWCGMKPVFCDIDPATLNLDPIDMERRVTPASRVIMPTHIFGVLADMEAVLRVARAHNLKVMVDAAHAFDCDRGGVFPGGFGAPEFLSFHATKFFGTFEGGAVLTNDDGLAVEMRALRNFGFAGVDDVPALGINAKSSEISAAFGLASLPELGERWRRLREIHDLYVDELAGIDGLRIHRLDALGRNNHRYFAVFIDTDAFGLPRDALYRALWADNVLARRYFYPGCHRMRYYLGRDGRPGVSLPKAERALDDILCLPTSFVGVDGIEAARKICELIRLVKRHAAEVDAWYKSGAWEKRT